MSTVRAETWNRHVGKPKVIDAGGSGLVYRLGSDGLCCCWSNINFCYADKMPLLVETVGSVSVCPDVTNGGEVSLAITQITHKFTGL